MDSHHSFARFLERDTSVAKRVYGASMQNTYTTVGCNVYNFDVALLTGVSVANTALTPHHTIGETTMSKTCPYYKNNPQSNECALLPETDCCELAHSASIGYMRECFIYEMRHIYQKRRNYPNHKRETRVSAHARSLA